MSHYTTEVRFICEQKAGLSASVGASEVDNVLNQSWNKIFANFPIYDESYRATLCKKILKHYYLREICCETVGIWIMWLNQKMDEIMPYYNKLYKAAALEFNPLWNTDYNRVGNRDHTETEDISGHSTDDRSSTQTRDNTVTTDAHSTDNHSNQNRDLYSDTPQGALNGVEDEEYLTNARKITDAYTGDFIEDRTVTDDGTTTQKDDYQGTTASNKDATRNEDYTERVSGKTGSESYGKLLEDYRKSLWNIDVLIIGELEDLFFGLY